jgi:hypothetical protein
VKREREEGRFGDRGEQLLKMEYVSERRKYERAMAKAAPDFGYVVEDDEMLSEEEREEEQWRQDGKDLEGMF